MNIITKGTNNTVVFTLDERRTLTSPYFLVRMQSRSSQGVKRFILASDLSTSVGRYNQFTITETSGTEVLTSGTVTLSPEGFWDYAIYEQSSASNLNELASDNLIPLEVGLVQVRGSSVTNSYYSQNNSGDKFFGQ